jgi:hypothetical protein
MNFKEFFKPTPLKIVFTILLAILIFVSLGICNATDTARCGPLHFMAPILSVLIIFPFYVLKPIGDHLGGSVWMFVIMLLIMLIYSYLIVIIISAIVKLIINKTIKKQK